MLTTAQANFLRRFLGIEVDAALTDTLSDSASVERITRGLMGLAPQMMAIARLGGGHPALTAADGVRAALDADDIVAAAVALERLKDLLDEVPPHDAGAADKGPEVRAAEAEVLRRLLSPLRAPPGATETDNTLIEDRRDAIDKSLVGTPSRDALDAAMDGMHQLQDTIGEIAERLRAEAEDRASRLAEIARAAGDLTPHDQAPEGDSKAIKDQIAAFVSTLPDAVDAVQLASVEDGFSKLQAAHAAHHKSIEDDLERRRVAGQKLRDSVRAIEPHPWALDDEKQDLLKLRDALAEGIPDTPSDTELETFGKERDEIAGKFDLLSKAIVDERMPRFKKAQDQAALIKALSDDCSGPALREEERTDLRKRIAELAKRQETYADWTNIRRWGASELTTLVDDIGAIRDEIQHAVDAFAKLRQALDTQVQLAQAALAQPDAAELSPAQKEAFDIKIETARKAGEANIHESAGAVEELKVLATAVADFVARIKAFRTEIAKTPNAPPAGALKLEVTELARLRKAAIDALESLPVP
ncbi:hypothetical protein [Sedimentitalea todarodis]|uniref:Uncharacterized protein n=1 Tax=Sedimentitalea todarodis TaxID=1631240 RepID=A0ABU3VLI7_9RHOB|nr:hypothetical protein [Sedimentitalea todarodis]MDU9007047.1 hypothetical protein [Sedimentitalea todarodis]